MTTDYEKQEQARQSQREREWREAGATRSKERREKQIKRSGLSTTKSAHSMIEKKAVVEDLENRIAIEEAKRKGTDKKDWYQVIADTFVDVNGQEKRQMDFFESCRRCCLAHLLRCGGSCLVIQRTIVYAGRAYSMTMLSCIMYRIPGMRRELQRLRVAAAQRHSQLHKRIELVKQLALKRGFNPDGFFDEWDERRCRMVGSLLVQCRCPLGLSKSDPETRT